MMGHLKGVHLKFDVIDQLDPFQFAYKALKC